MEFKKRLNLGVLALICSLLGVLIFEYSPLAVAAVLFFTTLAVIMLRWPELATLAVIFALYSNLGPVAVEFQGVPQVASFGIYALLAVPLAYLLFFRRGNLVVDRTFLLMLLFLLALVIASAFATDLGLAAGWVATFILEGLILYLLVVNVVRSYPTMRRVLWVLLITGSLLGALSLFQEVTQDYENQFGGFAQRKVVSETGELGVVGVDKVRRAQRAQGPLGDPNRYAQSLLVILPLSFFLFWSARRRSLKILAAGAGALILCGVVLTYSRGAFLTMIGLLVFAALLRIVRPSRLLPAGVALVLLVALAAPGYLTRIESLRGVEGLLSRESQIQPEAVLRGRTTEMLAALMVFLDHPLLGVGPGNYTPLYSLEYQLDPQIAFRHIPKARRAHILYFELAAETGIVGFALFMAVVLALMHELWAARRRLVKSHPDLALLAAAFLLSIFAYLGTAVFLQLAYQRYYWLLLALAGAALRICRVSTECPVAPTYGASYSPRGRTQMLR